MALSVLQHGGKSLYPYTVHDKKTFPRYMRRMDNSATIGTVTTFEDPYTTMFKVMKTQMHVLSCSTKLWKQIIITKIN